MPHLCHAKPRSACSGVEEITRLHLVISWFLALVQYTSEFSIGVMPKEDWTSGVPVLALLCSVDPGACRIPVAGGRRPRCLHAPACLVVVTVLAILLAIQSALGHLDGLSPRLVDAELHS